MIKNTLPVFLFFVLTLLVSCEGWNTPKPDDNEALIGDEIFAPTESTVTNEGDRLVLQFTDGTHTVEIITNDTLEGTYNITADALKAASLLANISYTDGTTTWYGTSGSVVIGIGEDGYEGSYEATLEAGDTSQIGISSGSFSGIEATQQNQDPLINSEQAILDSLLSCYTAFNEFIQFEYLFDAVYTHRTGSPGTDWSNLVAHTQNSTDVKIAELWNRGWDVIFRVNLIVLSADEVITNEADNKAVKSQALGMRACTYLNLLQWFAYLPVVTETSFGSASQVAQSDVLEFILSDAFFAAEYAPQTPAVAGTARIPSAFGKAVAAEASLMKEDFAASLNLHQDIINSGNFALNPSPGSFTPEDTEIFYGSEKGSIAEFSAFFTYGTFVPVERLTASYLVSAESLVRMGNSQEALGYYNILRERRFEDPATVLEGDMLYIQYLTEFEAEGKTFSVMKRFGKAESELQLMTHQLVLPIPMQVLDEHVNFLQNPGY
ncbi:MAG: RagB/SusD family nutrient uptake outer membrane protein [Bacteroidota bacterium]